MTHQIAPNDYPSPPYSAQAVGAWTGLPTVRSIPGFDSRTLKKVAENDKKH
jgi:hypothetical protein